MAPATGLEVDAPGRICATVTGAQEGAAGPREGPSPPPVSAGSVRARYRTVFSGPERGPALSEETRHVPASRPPGPRSDGRGRPGGHRRPDWRGPRADRWPVRRPPAPAPGPGRRAGGVARPRPGDGAGPHDPGQP